MALFDIDENGVATNVYSENFPGEMKMQTAVAAPQKSEAGAAPQTSEGGPLESSEQMSSAGSFAPGFAYCMLTSLVSVIYAIAINVL